ncbi:MAG: DUF2807 domain-containing protein [Alphaproteobacteria bacterium]|nr:DUF2807 domain-containing protein [Alphaproteobacteria bacterium]
MSRTLAIIAVVGLVLCAALFALARTIGGDAIFHDSKSFAGIKPLIDLATHKEWRWDGGDSLALEAPVNVVYRQNGPPGVTVTGSADQLQHVKVGGGRIVSDNGPVKAGAPKLTAVIGGMALRKFSVNGGENLDLGKIEQDELELHLNGHGSITGTGRVNRLDLTIAGSGKAALGGLSVGDAQVSIYGSGKGIIAPHGTLNLFVTGSGKIALASKPAKIEQNVLGSGGIVDVDEIVDKVMASVRVSVPVTVNVPMPVVVPPQPPVPHSGDVRNLVTLGGKNVDLGHLDQKSLTVTIPGSGKVRAEGKVENLTVTIFGSGKADFGKLAAGDVKVTIFGSGDAFLAPSGNVNVAIKGSGTVHLRTRPKSVSQSLQGSGQVVEDY